MVKKKIKNRFNFVIDRVAFNQQYTIRERNHLWKWDQFTAMCRIMIMAKIWFNLVEEFTTKTSVHKSKATFNGNTENREKIFFFLFFCFFLLFISLQKFPMTHVASPLSYFKHYNKHDNRSHALSINKTLREQICWDYMKISYFLLN